ncbi:MAG: hypothetical protein JWN17_2254 [Frankiales bacterium]|nr:hypothetical protein [Frankiales bacterium]
MARQSSNPVFQRSTALHESLRGTGQYAPSADEVAGIYATPTRLTYDDIVVKTGILLGIIVVTGTAAWVGDLSTGAGALAGIVGFVLALVNMFKRKVSPPLVLAYAALEGVFLGAISHLYNDQFGGGIVTQAVLGSTAVFAAVLFGYKSGKLRATPKFTKIVTLGFMGLFGLVVLDLVVSLFAGGDALGIRGGNVVTSVLFSVAFIVFGALTFVLDFDQAERMVEAGVDSRESWRIAFGLVVGLVWLYLEVLRLLSYLQGRR